MSERIQITTAAPLAESRVDGGRPISYPDVAEEIWQALKRKAAGERDGPPIGLLVQGGGMRGVYSLAVLGAFEEMGWTHCFDHVAGASAGAMNGAHFITGQARYGVETYIHHLSNRKFIDFFRLRKLVDVDYMIDDLVRYVRPFNLPALLEASTELHIALADAEDASVHYVTNRSEDVDLWEAFRATGALPILYNRFVKVGDRLYLDGSLSDGLSLPRLLALGCRYIVVVLTKPLSFRSQRVSRPVRALAWWATRQYSPALKRALFDGNLHFNRTMSVLAASAQARVHEAVRILVIAPSSEEHLVRCVTTNRRRLKRCAWQGRADAWQAFGQLPPTMHPVESPLLNRFPARTKDGRP
jgi:predicted patatin/cPLA2 family phospholipase